MDISLDTSNRNRRKMRWPETTTLEFVRLYVKHECLWNRSHEGYKVKHHRDLAYRAMIMEFNERFNMNLTVLDTKLKIKTLRTTYIQEVHKIMEKTTPDCVYESSLLWFNEMDKCLKDVIPITMKKENHLTPAYNSIPDSQEIDSSSQVWNDQSSSIDLVQPDPLSSHTDDEFKDQYSGYDVFDEKPKVKKRKHRSQKYEAKSNLDSNGDDEFDIFGKYIASQLRSINLQKAIRLKLEIQSLVSDARLTEMNDGYDK